jgi:hypothetical protein
LVKLCLSDRDTGRLAWASGGTVFGAVSTLEAALASGNVEWRKSKPVPAGRRN